MFIQNLKTNGLVDHAMFMLNLDNTDDSSVVTYPGGFIIGQSEIASYLGKQFDNIIWTNVLQSENNGVISYNYWTTLMESMQISVNGTFQESTTPHQTIIDSGTSILYLCNE